MHHEHLLRISTANGLFARGLCDSPYSLKVVIQNPDESSADALVVGFAPGSREALAANVAAQDVPSNSADTS